MTFDERRRIALALAARAQLSGWAAAPLPYRLLWRLGVRVPPPHFAGFLANGLILTASALLALFPWALWKHASVFTAVVDVLPICALAGFGAALGGRFAASKHGLPAWEDVQSADQPIGRDGVLNLRS